MKPTVFPPIPYDTAQAALSVFGRSNSYLVIGDQVEALFDGICLRAPLDSLQRQSHKVGILYLCTIFQHLEGLPDQLAIDALRERVDWKYALHLSMKPAPIEAFMLCEFRKTAALDRVVEKNIQTLLMRLAEIPQVALCSPLKQDPNHVIRHVCQISRLAKIWEAINQTLAVLAAIQSSWLLANNLPHWYERYGRDQRYLNLQTGRQELEFFAQAVGSDGFYILEAITVSGEKELADLPEVLALQKIWSEQFEHEKGKVIWRNEACGSCASHHQTQHAIPKGHQSEKPV